MKKSLLMQKIFDQPIDEANIWKGEYKIPWNDEEFSKRMLSEHLCQDHDLASRKEAIIRKQVAWIHTKINGNSPCYMLDLACGPGLYLNAFARLGYTGRGLDFAPASIAYACKNQLSAEVEFSLEDLRSGDYGQKYDLITMIYGEFNVFSKEEMNHMVARMYAALKPGGKLLVEVQNYDHVKSIGQAPNSWFQADSGLFSTKPHLCLTRNYWFENSHASVQQFFVIDGLIGNIEVYNNTTQAYSEEEFYRIFQQAGFEQIQKVSDWPVNIEALELFYARKPLA